jgi:hypothetical protein
VKISELTALFAKVQNIAGDVEVALKNVESEAETVITDLTIHLSPADGATNGGLTIEHATAGPPPPVPQADTAPAADVADGPPTES